jgi:hypothetical protein
MGRAAQPSYVCFCCFRNRFAISKTTIDPLLAAGQHFVLWVVLDKLHRNFSKTTVLT